MYIHCVFINHLIKESRVFCRTSADLLPIARRSSADLPLDFHRSFVTISVGMIGLADVARESSGVDLLIPALDPILWTAVSVDPFEIVARFVIVPLDVATTVVIHKILPAVACLVLVG